MGVRPIDASANSVGYCSWYYHYEQITEERFMESVRGLAARKDAFPARYAQIDYGYAPCHGDWLSRRPSWPTPLPDLVKQINDLGFEAGIWTMPFLAATSSEIFRKHPDWFVRDRQDQPWCSLGWSPEPDHLWACLDLSRGDVQQYFRDLFDTLHEWGFRYFKLDGGGFSIPPGRRSDPAATGVTCLRTGLKIIREAVGDCIVVGCAIPFLPSLGLVDHSRLSGDIGKTWRAWGPHSSPGPAVDESEPLDPIIPCLENSLHGSLDMWWMCDRWFRGDPDVVMTRDDNTSLTVGEARMTALVAIVTGVTFTSDRLDTMSDDRLRLLSLTAHMRLRDARPADWEQRLWPYVWEGTLDGRPAAAVFNYSDQPQQWDLSDLLPGGQCEELLHPLGTLSGPLCLGPHDGALIVALS